MTIKKLRNFWVTAKVSGRKTDIGFGPLDPTQGFNAQIYINDKGKSKLAVEILATVEDNMLNLYVEPNDDAVKVQKYHRGFVVRTFTRLSLYRLPAIHSGSRYGHKIEP